MSAKLILLIEHDESVREVLRVCLMYLAGWNVVLMTSTQDSLETLIHGQPDAILLDTVMPKANELGFIQKRFIQKLKENPLTRSTPILLLADQANWFTPNQLRSLGIEGTIAKPFDPTRLPAQISHILGWTVECSSFKV